MPFLPFLPPRSSSTLTERVARERAAHTERDVLGENLRLKRRFPHVDGYPSRRRLEAALDARTRRLEGQTVLDYGCGRGEASLTYLARGAERVCGIDLSPVYIDHASAAARAAGFSEERYRFRVMDAHRLDFEDERFDLVVGRGILHHLSADVALDELHRVLRPGGRVLLVEPLADHPLLRLFRWLTPQARTEDEAPFTGKEITRIADRAAWHARLTYCGLLEAPAAVLTSLLMPGHPDNAVLRAADRVEAWLHRRGVLDGWNQYVLLDLEKV